MKNYDIFNSIKRSDTVCIIGHCDPDTDDLTSLVLMKQFLKNTLHIKAVDIFAEYTNLPEVYTPIIRRANLNPTPNEKYDVAISVDSPSIERLSKFGCLFSDADLKIVIDHHATNSNFGDYNFADNVSSTCEIIYDIMKTFNHKFTRQNYGMLYAGIMTDTNNFTVGNITPSAYIIASECSKRIDVRPIYKQFMNNHTLKNMQLLSLAINNITTHLNERIIITHISTSDAQRYAAGEDDYLGIVNRIAAISNCELVAFIHPKNDTYYVSMRACEGLSVAELAKKYGGGGHRGAAAFGSALSINELRDILLKEFEIILSSSNRPNKFEF